jgi:hypothetical protein
MITTIIQQTALITALAFLANTGSGAHRRACEQRELKEALERAPEWQTESLGEPARGVPARLLGLTVTGAASGKPQSGLLYGVDVTTGEVLFRKVLPSPVSTQPEVSHAAS